MVAVMWQRAADRAYERQRPFAGVAFQCAVEQAGRMRVAGDSRGPERPAEHVLRVSRSARECPPMVATDRFYEEMR